MFLTITIQTYNHAAGLGAALASLARLRCPPAADYEVLVVDNNSTDGTAGVIEEYQGVLGRRLRGVFEPQLGLSEARNRALAEARGEVVCFLDDDALADPGWLAGHAAVYESDGQVTAVAGRIELQWPAGWRRPAWLARELEGYLSGLDLGSERLVLEYPRYPYGCNMSVRRDLARQAGGFSTRLGRRGRSLRSNEEKLFFHKIRRQGGRLVYTPDALVRHVVPARRLSRGFFLRRAYAQGVSDVLFRREVDPPANGGSGSGKGRAFLRGGKGSQTRCIAFGVPKLLASLCVRGAADLLRRRDSAACFLTLARAAYAVGYVAGSVKWEV